MSRTVNLGKIVPERGTDYWTAQDKAEIISTATTNVENNFASTIATIQSNSSNALNTANTANNTANTAKSIAEGANQALSYTNYQAMITAFNELADNVYKVGQNIMIITLNVPDLWISAIENTSITYNYTNDEAITTALSTNGYIQVGYYKLSALETQKVDLTDYYTKTGTENKIEDYLYQIMPTDSASGTIATINDSTTMFNAIDITGTIEPVQDLHGYDNPWPAGGGLNKIPLFESKTVNGVTLTNNNGEITLNGTATADAYFDVDVNISVPNGSTLYLCCFNPVATDSRVSLFLISDNGNPQSNMNVANKMTTTTTTADMTISKFRLCAPIGVTLTSFKCSPMLQIGGTAPTVFSPYSNICPITGWTGASVVRTGKNSIPNLKTQDTSTRVRLGESSVGNGAFYKAGTYKISFGLATAQTVGIYWRTFKNGENGPVVNSDTIVITEDVNVKVWLYASDGISVDNVLWWQVELGSTATPYEPYQSETYDITFPSEAGTVYGGTLDVTTGVLTVDMAIVDMGTLNWLYYSDKQRIVAQVNVGKPAMANIGLDGACSVYKVVNTRYKSAPDKSVVIGNNFISNSYAAMVVHDEDYTDAKTFKTAVSGQMIVFPIKTPVTYQLTPQQIAFLLGTNNLWVDTGDINVTYKADIQKYIDKKTN